MLVYSPSNMSTYLQCPRKFQAQTITKEIKWKESPEKKRGIELHNTMERAIKGGWDSVKEYPDSIDRDFTRRRIEVIRQLMAQGASCYTEHEMTINRMFKPSTWWGEDAFLRCKADVLLLPPDSDRVVLLDWKTGKHWDSEDFQLRVEALISYFIYQRPVIQYSYLYVDSGDTQSGIIDLKTSTDSVSDILGLLKEMEQAAINNSYVPKANRFCKWCGLFNTPGCGL